MLRRLACCVSVTTALLASASPSGATTGFLADSNAQPVEQRIAVATTASRTTTWTSLRFSGDEGSVALIVPAAAGAQVDVVSDAWFEALEDATAPRILPPLGARAGCPGAAPLARFQVAGRTSHDPTLTPDEVTVLPHAADVADWAAQNRLGVSTELQQALTALGTTSFVAARFTHPAGANLTQTLRVVVPGSDGFLPLTLVRAGRDADLLVTVFQLGEGRGTLTPTTPALLSASAVSWQAAEGVSDYLARRTDALVASSETAMLESASHTSLVTSETLGAHVGSIDGLVATYFERGAAYQSDAAAAVACVSAATSALGAAQRVGLACAPGALATVPPAPGCAEPEHPIAGELDASALRCLDVLDDLAVGLSGLVAADVWLTRQSLLIERSRGGPDIHSSAEAGPEVSSIVVSGRVELTGCGTASGQPGTGPGPGHGPGDGTNSGTNDGSDSNYSDWSSDSGSSDWGFGTDTNVGSEDLNAPSDSCSGSTDSSGASSDSCSGSTDSSGASSDSCSGSSSDGSDSCDSGGSSGGDSCDSGGGSSGCDSGGGSSGCSGGGAGSPDCSIGFGRGTGRPRASILVMFAMAILAPLRRRGTKKRARATVAA